MIEKNESLNDSLPLVLGVPEAAKILRIGLGRCYELVRCGRLRNIRVGKKILIPRNAIFEFLGMTEGTPA
jgi:excisionase family DNA binding protein